MIKTLQLKKEGRISDGVLPFRFFLPLASCRVTLIYALAGCHLVTSNLFSVTP